jgi:hypothetical protein
MRGIRGDRDLTWFSLTIGVAYQTVSGTRWTAQ